MTHRLADPWEYKGHLWLPKPAAGSTMLYATQGAFLGLLLLFYLEKSPVAKMSFPSSLNFCAI